MKEETIVRENLMTEQGYRPYCGNNVSRNMIDGCDNPRTRFNGEQFVCIKCGWTSNFPSDFMQRYKQKWNIKNL